MGEPTVSVVIPTFRRVPELLEAIDSVLSQEGVDVDLIVVDDSPEGSAREAVTSLGDPRVQYHQRSVPTGGVPGMVRNEGWTHARGDFVHFLDDDDRLAPHALARLVAALRERPSAGVAVGVVKPFGDDPDALRHEERYFSDGARILRQRHPRLLLVASMLFGRTPLVNSACMVRRACFERVGGYSADVRYVEDVDFYLRAIRRCGYVFVDTPVVHYRVGTPSLMHSLADLTVLRGSYRAIYRNYIAAHGRIELLGLRALALALRLVRLMGPSSAALLLLTGLPADGLV